MTIKEKLKQYQQDKKAILATNFYNLETLQAIVRSASKVQVPVILQLTKSSIDYIGLKQAVVMARQALADYQLEGWLHLDHGNSVDLIQRCLDAGFDSVMIDASEKSFDENICITSEVVKRAESYRVNVEAELGYIAKLGQQQGVEYTTAEEAKMFVEQTGINALAIAIGSAHGFYKSTPQLNIERLGQIHTATDAILVLHGSSGIPDEQLKDAIENGITKVNLATDIKNAFIQSLKKILGSTDEIDLRKVFPKARESVENLLVDKYKVINDLKHNYNEVK
jgi:fructose-bisphosphate aldolase class II/tagatose 1,6-diphosphate aldolase GatY/KbaY